MHGLLRSKNSFLNLILDTQLFLERHLKNLKSFAKLKIDFKKTMVGHGNLFSFLTRSCAM